MAEKIYVIDGHSLLYACYFAIRTLTSPNGQPTNATYGVISTVLKMMRDHRPDYLVAVFDPPGKTFRNDLYPNYKANRPPMPEDLAVQIDQTHRVLRAMGIAVISVQGFEADDVIATIVKKVAREGLDVVICSKDKDLQQLLGKTVRMFDTTKDQFLDAESLRRDKGITADQVVDLLTMAGDPADNIPGIPGVGPKTAVKLIKQYGRLENVIACKDQLAAKIRTFFADPAHLDQLTLAQKLVSLRFDVPVDCTWQDWRADIPDRADLAKLFADLGFNRFIQQLDLKVPAETVVEGEKPIFTQVRSIEQLDKLVGDLTDLPAVSVDTETTGTDPMAVELVGLSLAGDERHGYYVPIKTIDGQHLDREKASGILKPLLEDTRIAKVGQNLKYDVIVLRNAGIRLANIAFDTMIASYLLDPSGPHNLDALAEDVLGYKTIRIEELIGTGKGQLTLDQVATERVADYAAEDALVAFRLFRKLEPKLRAEKLDELFDNVEMPLLSVLAEMEYNGVTIDAEKLARLSDTLTGKVDALARQIVEHVGHPFNIDSPKQLADVLFDELKLPILKRTKTGRSTDVSVLTALAWRHPVPKLVLDYRALSKLKNTYVDKLPEMINVRTGKIHASFNQTVAATGRLSSSGPNLQNIPIRSEIGREIRSAFVVGDDRNNVLLTCDYSQIELRLLAHFSADANLVKAFREDLDIHTFVASQVFGVDINLVTADQRGVAKTVNFGLMYGQTAHGLAQTLGISRAKARKFIDEYFARYAGVKHLVKKCVRDAETRGYATTILGRRRPIPELRSQNKAARAFGERMAFNTVVQGSAADLIKVAMVNLHRTITAGELPAVMLIQVHDELVFETPKSTVETTAGTIAEMMSNAIGLNVPMKVAAAWGANWLEGK